MPVVSETGAGRRLVDAGGAAVAHFEARERDGTPLADLFEASEGAAHERVAELALRELPGWRIACDPALAALLVAGGGTARRHVHAMSRDLVRDPAPTAWLEPARPDGVRLTSADRPAIDLAPAARAAYPPDHADYPEIANPDRPELELEEVMSGRLLGPLLRCSGLAVGEDGAVLGAVLVNGSAGEPPFGGAWISQVFRRPDAPGIGGPLLRRALGIATRDGLPAVGLAVTHGNPARQVYAALGFADRLESLNVQL